MLPNLGVVIVGAGQAGGDLTDALRNEGYRGAITLIGDEPYAPYRRPPLSKAFLAGETTLDSLYLKSSEAYARQGIDCRYGTGVESIDREARALRLFNGITFEYEQLVLATGGRPRRLALPGADHLNVHYVRTIDDIERLRHEFLPDKHLVIIGGGYIGLEVASIGIKKHLKVTLVEALPRVLARVAGSELSAFFERTHRSRGVEVLTGIGVQTLEGEPFVDTVVLTDGRRLAADLVIVGIGLIPNTELAEAANLDVSNGIVVDAYMRTNDAAIYAIGDCSNHENRFLGRRLRLESVANAADHARICAASICGRPAPCMAVPWFWSDQYELKLQTVGLSHDHDEIALRGDPAKESFCVFYLREGVIIAADAVNRALEFMIAKRLVSGRARAPVEQLTDDHLPLKSLLALSAISRA